MGEMKGRSIAPPAEIRRSTPGIEKRPSGGREAIKRLGISWGRREKGYMMQQLAEMFTPAQAADNVLREFAGDWNLGDLRAPGAEGRAREIRAWLLGRAKYLSYDRRSAGDREEILRRREEWRGDLEGQIREASRAARIRDLAVIKDLAMRDKRYQDAIAALRAIQGEMAEIAPPAGAQLPAVRQTKEEEIDGEIRRILAGMGAGLFLAARLGATPGAAAAAGAAQGEGDPAEVVEGSARVLPGALRDPAGDHPVVPAA